MQTLRPVVQVCKRDVGSSPAQVSGTYLSGSCPSSRPWRRRQAWGACPGARTAGCRPCRCSRCSRLRLRPPCHFPERQLYFHLRVSKSRGGLLLTTCGPSLTRYLKTKGRKRTESLPLRSPSSSRPKTHIFLQLSSNDQNRAKPTQKSKGYNG